MHTKLDRPKHVTAVEFIGRVYRNPRPLASMMAEILTDRLFDKLGVRYKWFWDAALSAKRKRIRKRCYLRVKPIAEAMFK